ncbi:MULTISPECIES: DUF929 family protein [Acidithrix]|uniref:DUF929 domain-containing protein n=1 Tax=Acidithrix ferrooxidans TaxID=1280514 RepID=A0A0D8HLR1_9ACTN|nr:MULTISPECIES: DUF929 family protein [Acidithrix]KJF18925.1 hypothetical protein AXFE_02120 [Acidithrix ferrooxidans]
MAQKAKKSTKSSRQVTAAKNSGSQKGMVYSATALVVIVAVIATFILIKLNKSSSSATATNSLAPAAVVSAVTKVPNSALAAATVPTSSIPLPYAVKNTALLTSNSKPVVLYMGADYCPYCAAQRWPLIIALSKFGTFKNLHTTSSSSTDVYPNTQTFSFYGSSYSSPYINFQSVEMQTNIPSNGSYTTLQTPTTAQNNIFNTYDKPPYTATATGIPFIDYGNQLIEGGPAYSPAILAGLSRASIAGSLTITGTVTNQAILPSANLIIASICKIDKNQPGSICSMAPVATVEKLLK